MGFDFLKAATTAIEMLVKYGPWAMCVILIILLVLLYYSMNKKHQAQIKDLTDLLEKRNNQLVALVQKCSSVLTHSTSTLNETKVLMTEIKFIDEDLKKMMNETVRTVDRCKYAAKPKD